MSRQPDQFADELRLLAESLEVAARVLRKDADRAQAGADEFDRVVEERDELRAEVARMRPVVEAALALHPAEGFPPVGAPAELYNAVRAFREGGGS